MKKYYYVLGTLQAFTALGAIPAGYGMLKDTSGAGLGMSAELLSNSPLQSFLLPGLFLLFVNGISNLVASILSFTGNRFAAHAGIALGIALMLWIIIQVLWITQFSFLQPLFLIIGLVNTWLGCKILKAETPK